MPGLLRFQSAQIPGNSVVSRTFSSPKQLHGQTLQADAQPAVGRHAVFESASDNDSMPSVSHAPFLHLFQQLVIIMDPLAAGGDLQPLKQQVKA